MKKPSFFPIVVSAFALVAGCASVPQSALLDDARSAYASAQADPQVTTQAPLELKEAGDTLARANAAQTNKEDQAKLDQLAYLAKQQVTVARETARRKAAEMSLADAAKERDRIRLNARTAEADRAKQDADAAKQQALMSDEANRQKSAQLAMSEEANRQKAAELATAAAAADRDRARLAQLEQEYNDLNARKTDRGMVITLGDVLFDTGRADLKPGGVNNVRKLAAFLKEYPQRKVLIEGYTDSTGSDSLNQELSERRADSVRNALLDGGIESGRIATRGHGKAYPVAGNDTAAGRQLNRRVEIVLSDDNGNIAPR
jgi:outer membrane protein OmpA-like peptidoglycan-associated protein